MSWDDEDFDFDELVPEALKKEEPKPEPAAAPVATSTEGLRGKAAAKARAKILAEREAAEAEAAARRRAMLEESTGDDDVDRRRRHEMQVRADLEAAEDAFGDVGSVDGDEAKEPEICDLLAGLSLNKPSKFEELATAAAKRVESAGSRPDTMVFLRKLLSEITGDLRPEDLKELSKMLDIERNRKVDAERAARGGGKKKKALAKPKINASKGSGAWDEYSDFM